MNDTPVSDEQAPLTWVLTGHKAGDNSQVLALADALQWPTVVKRIRYRPWELLSNRLLGVTLSGIDRRASSELYPPWPGLVITAGRRNEPVARWIKRASGGRSRLVHVGRPWAALRHFDLIVTTPQYFLPARDNVLHNQLPLHAVDAQRLEHAAGTWRDRFAALPRPRIAVLVGGNSGAFVFTAQKGQRLGALADAMARDLGGSLLVTNSPRTPADFYRALVAAIRVPAHVHHWRADQQDNPYLAYLALADRLVVTGESMSMLAEAAATQHPLYIFDPADVPSAGGRPWWLHGHNLGWRPLSHRLAMRLGPRRMRREVGNIQRELVASGRAAWLGQDAGAPAAVAEPRDLQRACERVRALFRKA